MKEIKYTYLDNQTFNESQNIDLRGETKSVEITGQILLWDNTDSNIVLNINHIEPNTKSYVKIRAILKDNAKLNISGSIHIGKEADNSDAYLEVKVLLLGEKAKANVVPELKIDNKNVSARHAVVVKKIDENDLYFLESRGIEEIKARELISEGFLHI